MDRRSFLHAGGLVLIALPATCGLRGMVATAARAATGSGGAGSATSLRWGMVIDLTRCEADCTACVDACRHENNVAYHDDKSYDIYWIRKVKLSSHDPAASGETHLPLLCNHCDNPPCAQVCPVQATYRRADGIVIVDHHRCIGCRYCMIACPYNARFFNYKHNPDWPNQEFPRRSHGVAEACNLCAHRLDVGEEPACVSACRARGMSALHVGNLDDPDSEVSRMIAKNNVQRIREDLGTEPKVYYIGLPVR